MSRALIWGKVGHCRPNMAGDMMKNVKMGIFKKCQILHFLAFLWHKLTFFENPCFFLSYLWSYLAYRDVLYIKLKLLRFCFDLMLSFLAPASIFVEQLRQEVVSFVFRVAQTFFVPNFYIALIWQLFLFFLWFFSSYAKELMHMISWKKEIVYLIPFHRTEFSNSFCQRFFDSPFKLPISEMGLQ